MSERGQLKGELFEAQEAAKRKDALAKGHCERVRDLLNPLLSEIEEMRIVEAAELMDELVVLQAELLRLGSKADQLKKALYG